MTNQYTYKSNKEWRRVPFLYPATIPDIDGKYVILEVGPGRGDFLFHLAKTNPEAIIVGIEIKPKRIDKIIKRIERQNLKNILLIQDDAREALPRFLHECSINEIHVNFPDPWPKKRHKKNRAVSLKFLNECYRILKLDGTLSIITDHETYANDVAEDIIQVKGFEKIIPENEIFPSLFATKWTNEGRKITHQKYKKY